ncbi:MAG: histidine--tRNA ligase [Bacillota bacterium]
MVSVRGPRGTADVLPYDSLVWQYVESALREICRRYNFGEVRTPIFEHTELFNRIGESTDVVRKEMYTFEDRGGRSLTLRPEGTAGAVRALIQHGLLAGPLPVKWYYFGPMFRYERPQGGRMRQFSQFGVEVFGAPGAMADAEVICLAMDYLGKVGLKQLQLEVNSLGCPACRPAFREALVGYLEPRKQLLCDDCRERLVRNPLRVLDCKVDGCKQVAKDAPSPIDYLCDSCRSHFDEVQQLLGAAGIQFSVNPHIVRGLDYYTRTVFEITHGKLGAQATVCGGGRYDNLVEELGGPPTPAVGFGLGLDRLILCLKEENALGGLDKAIDAFVVYQPDLWLQAFALARKLRQNGLVVEIDLIARSLKAQMKHGGRLNARFAVILGEMEAQTNSVTLKHMRSGEQRQVPADEVVELIREAWK